MKEKLRLLLRKPAVIALLIAELLVIGFALAAALRPAAAYTFTADQWENTCISPYKQKREPAYRRLPLYGSKY